MTRIDKIRHAFDNICDSVLTPPLSPDENAFRDRLIYDLISFGSRGEIMVDILRNLFFNEKSKSDLKCLLCGKNTFQKAPHDSPKVKNCKSEVRPGTLDRLACPPNIPSSRNFK